jgi:hypothetical protein
MINLLSLQIDIFSHCHERPRSEICWEDDLINVKKLFFILMRSSYCKLRFELKITKIGAQMRKLWAKLQIDQSAFFLWSISLSLSLSLPHTKWNPKTQIYIDHWSQCIDTLLIRSTSQSMHHYVCKIHWSLQCFMNGLTCFYISWSIHRPIDKVKLTYNFDGWIDLLSLTLVDQSTNILIGQANKRFQWWDESANRSIRLLDKYVNIVLFDLPIDPLLNGSTCCLIRRRAIHWQIDKSS